jgi:hypothetical protein
LFQNDDVFCHPLLLQYDDAFCYTQTPPKSCWRQYRDVVHDRCGSAGSSSCYLLAVLGDRGIVTFSLPVHAFTGGSNRSRMLPASLLPSTLPVSRHRTGEYSVCSGITSCVSHCEPRGLEGGVGSTPIHQKSLCCEQPIHLLQRDYQWYPLFCLHHTSLHWEK